LRQKYDSEPPIVQNHLHVIALVRFALMKSGKDLELRYHERGGAARTVEIVNVEGYQPFLDELRNLPRAPVAPK
jgi:hypothetical protein